MQTPRRSLPVRRIHSLAAAPLVGALLIGLFPVPAALARGGAKRMTTAVGPEGLLLSCSKDVTVRVPASAEWRDCEVGQPLSRADRVRTGRAGLTSVDWAGARLWLDPSSQLALDSAHSDSGSGSGKKSKGALQLVEGAVRISYDPAGQKGGKALRLSTSEGEVRVRGVARVEIGPGAGEMQVAVYDGQTEIVGKHGTVRVRAGTGAVFRRGSKEKLGGLIGAPAWTSTDAQPGLFFAVPQKAAGGAAAPGATACDLALPFRPVQGAVRYRLEIGRDDALVDRVFLGTLSAENKVAAARLLSRGRYFARIQAVDSDQVAGPGPIQAVEVVELRGEHLVVDITSSRLPLLSGAGELSFEVIPGSGKLAVEVDGKDGGERGGGVPVRLSRGPHRLVVRSSDGARGELRAEVTRPSYAIDIVQDARGRSGRGYRFEVRALDTAGQSAEGGVKARSAPIEARSRAEGPAQALVLAQRGDGVFGGELSVPAGRTLRLTLSDADGMVASADLRGSVD